MLTINDQRMLLFWLTVPNFALKALKGALSRNQIGYYNKMSPYDPFMFRMENIFSTHQTTRSLEHPCILQKNIQDPL